ncbi:MAG TPA: DUF1345 domain-containing protein [Methylomirabilota bacterium]|jgi:uncharacterized membrane protein
MPLLFRVVRARPRLFTSIVVGIVVATVTAFVTDWRCVTRVLTGWDVAVVLYLGLAFHGFASSDIHRIRRNAARQDEGQLTILTSTVAAALASLAAIFAELGTSAAAPTRPHGHLVLAAATILLSWAFIHTVFALHYAHEFYDETAGHGLSFPGEEPHPDYLDFVYFSFVIGMTSQVSDVAITSRLIRRTATVHGIVSFLFNAALLALTINIAAGAI